MRTLSVEVFGDPVAQGSKRAFVVKGKPILTESAGARLKTWRSEIVSAARSKLDGGALEGPLRVTIFFFLRRPKRPKNELPVTRPDIDKLTRAVLDALEAAGVLHDDAQVVTLSARKRYGEPPRVTVTVSEESA